MTDNRFVIIDGSSMLSTCYYAVLPREILFAKTEEERQKHYGKILHAPDGTYTNGVFGMVKTIVSLIKKQNPAYMAFVFDRTRDTFRRELYADYKGTRSETPQPLKDQFALMEKILEESGFPVLYSAEYEADDYAGSLVNKFRGQSSIVVMTKDHDYLQLVDDKTDVRVWMVQAKQEKADQLYEKYYFPYGLSKKDINLPEKVFEFTESYVYGEEGVWPWQIPDLKGIQGDTSDNIPGVRGVSSAAVPLLREYGTVEGIYEVIRHSESDKKTLKEMQDFWKNNLGISRSPYKALTKKEEGQMGAEEMARLSKQLATIKTDLPVEGQLEDYRLPEGWEEEIRRWCLKLGMKEESIFGQSQ